MAKKGTWRKEPKVHGNPNDPDGLHVWVNRFLLHLRTKGQSEATIKTRKQALSAFIEWAAVRSIVSPREVSKPILESYQRALFHRRTKAGKPLSFRSQRAQLEPLKLLFRWLTRANILLANPASELELPKVPRRIPREIFSVTDVDEILRVPDITTATGLRDRAIIETLYSTGMRRKELANLHLYDLDAERGTIMIRAGKGEADRLIPIGDRAASWVQRYIDQGRPKLVLNENEPLIFVSMHGEAFNVDHLTNLVRGYVKRSKVPKTGSCHAFRHAASVHMMDNGADLRLIQALLGHVSIQTTSIYLLVSIRRLIDVHRATHPGAALRAPQTADAKVNKQEAVPVPEEAVDRLPVPTVAEFEAALEVEADEEDLAPRDEALSVT